MRSLLVLVVVAMGLAASGIDRFAGFLLYTWFAFFRPQEWSYLELASLRLSLVTAVAFVVPCLLTGVLPNVTHRLSLGSLAILGAAAVAHLNAVDPVASTDGLFKLALALTMVLLGVTLITTRQRLFWAVAVLAGSLGFHGAKVGVGYLIQGGARFTTVGIGGMFSDNNDFGFAIARNIFFLLAVATLVQRRWFRLGWFGAAALSALAVVSTYSRGAFLAAAAGAAVYLWVQPRRWLYLLGTSAVLTLGYFVMPAPEGYTERLSTISTYEEVDESSALSRLHYWDVAVDMVKAYPLGVGLGNYPARYDEFDTSYGRYGSGRAVHSTHFQLLSETGVLGAVAYGWLLLSSAWTLLRIRIRSLRPGSATDPFPVRMSIALLASLAAFVAGGSFLSQALNEMNWFLFGFVAALDRLLAAERAEADAAVEPVVAAPPVAQAHHG